METLVNGIAMFATAILLGAMVFFSGVMAPLIFAKLEAAVAGRFIRQVFPWYYLSIIVLGTIAAAALLAFRVPEGFAMAAVTVAAVVARQVLMPRINQARDAAVKGETPADTRFARLHRLSVGINLAQIITAGVVLARLAPAAA